MKDRVEILAPAGSMECLKAAIAAGADAVSERAFDESLGVISQRGRTTGV